MATVRQMLPEMLDVERRYGIDAGIAMQEQPAGAVRRVRRGRRFARRLRPASVPGDVSRSIEGRTIFGRCEYYLSLAGRKAGDEAANRVAPRGPIRRGDARPRPAGSKPTGR